MKLLAGTLTTLFLALVPTHSAWPWGADGHRTVGMIADILLEQQPAISGRVRQILGENRALRRVSMGRLRQRLQSLPASSNR